MRQSLAAIAVVGIACASPVAAQEDDDGGFLERLIENSLSGEDRDVVIRGFNGLLSGQATFDSLTISDPDGVWLTVTNAELDWSRLALLRGRLSVTELSAESIEVVRPPLPAEPELPDPEASGGFALPELPVAVNIGEIRVGRLSLGEPLFGEAAELDLNGSATLAGGEGDVSITANRLDGSGTFVIAGAYSNSSNVLDLQVEATEAADGIIVNLANIPGAPSLDLAVTGTGPLSDYAADVRLATDGQDRLTGRVTTQSTDAGGRDFAATIGGDITPLFVPQFRDFFGEDLALDIAAARTPDGVIDINSFGLEAQSLSLSGSLAIGAEGLPLRAAIDGNIADPDGSAVLLPTSGDPIRVETARLDVTFDSDTGDTWSADIVVTGLDGVGYSAERVSLNGTGQLVPTSPNRAVSGEIALAALELDLGGDEIDAAIGESVAGDIVFDWSEGSPLRFERLSIEGRDYGLDGMASVSGFGTGFDVTMDVDVRSDNLAAFSGVAGRPLDGMVVANMAGTAEALTGQFDLRVRAVSEDLSVGLVEADNILAGTAAFDLAARRDETGLRIESLTLESPNAQINGDVTLNSGSSSATVTAALTDLSLLVPDLPGPVDARLTASQNGEIWTYDVAANAPGAEASAVGTADTSGEVPTTRADVNVSADDLSVFAAIADLPLTGAVRLRGQVAGAADLSTAEADLSASLVDVTIGQPEADALLDGQTEVTVVAAKDGDAVSVARLSAVGQNLQLEASGAYGAGTGALDIDLAISDAAVLSPDLSGGVALTATASEGENGQWRFDLSGDAPSTAIAASGTAEPFADPIVVDAELDLNAGDLSVFAGIANLPLEGSATVQGNIAGTSDLSQADLDVTGRTTGVRTGIDPVDRLIGGSSDLRIVADLLDDTITIEDVQIRTRALNVEARGGTESGRGAIDLSVRLADLGVVLPEFRGPVALDGQVAFDGDGPLGIDVAGTGPGGIALTANGTAAPDGSDLRLSINGTAPLGLANQFITPISVAGDLAFDLAVNGPPTLASLSGRVTASRGRLVIPTANLILEGINATASLAAERATIDVSANASGGGTITARGPIALSAPFNGNIQTVLNSVVLTDGALYETRVSGSVDVDGPLAGGATIAGALTVSDTEINIAATGAGVAGAIPEISHLSEPAPVRQTREFAGLIRDEGGRGQGGGGRAYPLSLTVDVDRMFVRGRGLDTELAGQIRISGSTASPVTVGRIDLVRGRLNILGSRLRVEEGEILLQGSLVPVLRLRAVSERRTNDDVEAFVSIDGPVNDPQISFESEPPLPEDEVLARILFGSDLANISALQAAQLASAAATLAGRGGTGLVGGLREGLGVDDLDITTDEQGNTAVTAGAYLSEDLYADVTTRSDGETEVNLNLDLTDTITVTGSTANSGESTIGIFYQRDF